MGASPDKDSVKKLTEQLQDMKLLKADNKKGHTESMDALAKDNLEKTDERKAQYDAESDAQRHRNADGQAMNAMKIRDLRAANEKKSAAMRVDNEAEIVEMRRLGANGDAEHSAWMDGLRAKNKQKMAKMESDGQRKLSCGGI